MNPAYDQVLSAGEETRAGLFTTTALRLDSTPQNVEKDFWVCWTLDALFHGLAGWRTKAALQGRHLTVQGFWADPPLLRRH